MIPAPTPDFAAAVDFIRRWDPFGPWVFVAIETDPPAGRKRVAVRVEHPRPPRDPARLPDAPTGLVPWFESYHDRGWGLYFVPNRPDPANLVTTPTKEQVRELVALHVDLDLPKTGPYAEPTPENLARLARTLGTVAPAPTVTIFSGGGYQALWRFPEPLDALSNLPRVEAANRALERDLGADNCHNVNRLLRLPGSVNFPDARKRARGRTPTLARVVDATWARTWSFDDPVPRPEAPDELEPERSSTSSSTGAQPRSPRDPRPGRSIAELPVRLQRMIRDADAAAYDGDRSRLVFSVVIRLIRLGWADDDVLPVLTEPVYRLSEHVRAQSQPLAYARRQLERAHQVIAADWLRNASGGITRDSIANVRRALHEMGVSVAHDRFADQLWLTGFPSPGARRPASDALVTGLRAAIEARFQFLPFREVTYDALVDLGAEGEYDALLDYLNSLTWDGVPRLGAMPVAYGDAVTMDPDGTPSWLHAFGGAADDAFNRAVGRLFLIGAVRRARRPGTKLDEMLVLVSEPQGTNKSSAIAALCPDPDFFSENLTLGDDPKRTIEQTRGKWLVEVPELDGIHRTEIERVKTFLSVTSDEARLAWGRMRTDVRRRFVMFGSTNTPDFLRDAENRRFWPVTITRFDVAALAAARDQLWAEAAHAEAAGEPHRLHPALWRLATERQGAHRLEDPWAAHLASVLGELEGRLTLEDAWVILDRPPANRGELEGRRLTRALRDLGFERRVMRRPGGRPQAGFVRAQHRDAESRWIYVFFDRDARRAVASNDPNGVVTATFDEAERRAAAVDPDLAPHPDLLGSGRLN